MKAHIRRYVIGKTQSIVRESFAHLKTLGLRPTLDVYSDQNIAELLTQHPSRMAFGIFTYIFADDDGAIRRGRNEMDYAIDEELAQGFFELVGGQPRCSIIHDAFTYRIKGIPLGDYFEGFVKLYLSRIREDLSLANYPEIVLYEQNPSLKFLVELFGSEKGSDYYRCYEEFFQGIRLFEKSVIAEFRKRLEPEFLLYINKERQQTQRLEELNLAGAIAAIQRHLEHLRTVSCVTFVKVARLGFFAYARLKRKLEQRFGTEEGRQLLDKVTSGLEDAPSLRFNMALARLRDGVIQTTNVLNEFGHLGPNELEIATPRYHETPDLMKQYADRIVGRHEEEFSESRTESRRTQRHILAYFSPHERGNLLKDIETARLYLAMREKQKYYFLMEYDLIRQLLLRTERLLKLEEGDIFLLDPRELKGFLENTKKTLETIGERKGMETGLRQLEVPPVFFTDQLGRILDSVIKKGTQELQGIGVTSEVATGKAVIVLDPSDKEAIQRIRQGSILVAPTTDPTWAPLIASIGKKGGLITEVGGPLAHGAIVARELGIAAVLNVANATKIIKEGDLVKVDGKEGKVYILEE